MDGVSLLMAQSIAYSRHLKTVAFLQQGRALRTRIRYKRDMSLKRAARPFSLRSMVPAFLRRHLPRLPARVRRRVNAGLTLLLTGLAVLCGLATYAALAEVPPFGNDPTTILWLLNIDLVILLILVALVARRIVGIWSGRRRGLAGSKLHVRLVFIFSMLALTPAVIMTIFSASFFHFGLQGWFSDRIKNAIDQSEAFAEAYMIEHQNVIKADLLAMATDLDRSADSLSINREAFERFLQTQSFLRNFSEVILFDAGGEVVLSSGLSFSMAFETLPKPILERAAGGEVTMLTSGAGDERIRALVRLNNFGKAYLFVGRMVDPLVRERLDATMRAVQDYERLEAQRGDMQVKTMMMFVVVALLLLFAAMWFGLMLARQLASPIVDMITAADRVRAGDLTARVQMEDAIDEFEVLGRAFNRMTSQIGEQRAELIAANRQLDQRRRFTETVLAGVSSGVVGLDRDGRITLVNASASALLGQEAQALNGRKMSEILPDLEPLLEQAKARTGRMTQAEIPFQPSNGASGEGSGRRTLLVRIAIELIGEQDMGAVLTFDDITELQSAQRKAAWADVARRIAHEIKNPLTPIQLSAERLKRKYLKQIQDDPETFSQCTDTIIHHVGDIGRMVNEFSAFARMPEAVMKPENLSAIVREIAVFQNEAHPDVAIALSAPAAVMAGVDAQQVRQAVTNMVQNAIDVGATEVQILLSFDPSSQRAAITIHDNGPGLPAGVDPDRLIEPYVTHREKGTGLGLAIVKKIMDDHKGQILMQAPDWVRQNPAWRDMGGAAFVLIFPVEDVETKAKAV